jgi:uncharacterized protein (TIGR00269 family)
LIENGDKILVAISGGKDSLSCAHILSKLRNSLGFTMECLHIDVGILACTNERTENVVKKFCEKREIPYHIVRVKDILGKKLEKISRKRRRPICSVCGLVKRYIMNKYARENGFNKLATGHCADDMVRFFFKNWLSKHFDWIAKLKPIIHSNHPKVMTRIRPLFECLEAENLVYGRINNITIAPCSRCSYVLRKDKWNDILRLIDTKKPDFKINFVKGLEEVEFKIAEEMKLRECAKCGEPTSQKICGFCRLKSEK